MIERLAADLASMGDGLDIVTIVDQRLEDSNIGHTVKPVQSDQPEDDAESLLVTAVQELGTQILDETDASVEHKPCCDRQWKFVSAGGVLFRRTKIYILHFGRLVEQKSVSEIQIVLTKVITDVFLP